jgi:hypothetical protein
LIGFYIFLFDRPLGRFFFVHFLCLPGARLRRSRLRRELAVISRQSKSPLRSAYLSVLSHTWVSRYGLRFAVYVVLSGIQRNRTGNPILIILLCYLSLLARKKGSAKERAPGAIL